MVLRGGPNEKAKAVAEKTLLAKTCRTMLTVKDMGWLGSEGKAEISRD